MIRHGGFYDEQHRIRDKLAYEDFMHGVTNRCTIDGKTFTYPGTEKLVQAADDDAYIAAAKANGPGESAAL